MNSRLAGEQRLARVRRQIDHWRQTRAHPHAPMPSRLWAAAVALTRRHGLYGTARALRIDYGALKRHVEPAGRPEPPRPTFIAFPAAPPAAHRDCTIEIEGSGVTLRLRVPDLPLRDVATLGRWLGGLAS